MWGCSSFYLPYLKGRLDRSGLGAEVGYRGSMGAFAKLNMGGYEGDTWRSRSRLHLYSKRGVGFEQILSQRTDRSHWMFDGIYLLDEDPYQRYDKSEEKAHLMSSGIRFVWGSLVHHQQPIFFPHGLI